MDARPDSGWRQATASLLVAALAALLVGGCDSDPADARQRFAPGLVATGNHEKSVAAADKLGARIVRVEFDIDTRPAGMRADIAAITRTGARPLLLAGFHGRMPTAPEARNLGRWAAAFGPRKGRRLAVKLIEFGNETSYGDQYGDTFTDASYAQRAELYATRFAQAHRAIARHHVGLLAQADDGGTQSAVWVTHMFRAVPKLGRMVAGWTVHPYGPPDNWKSKLRRVVSQTAAMRAPASIPIDVTEYGLSTSGGGRLSDNYGWPTDMTYAQAAAALRQTVADMRKDREIRERLRLFLVYAAHDLREPGATDDREAYFGAFRSDLSPKGAYTRAVRRLFH